MATNGFKKYSSAPKAKEEKEIKYEIIEHFGKLSDAPDRYNKEVNLISWNEADPKFDIRPWKETEEEGRKMTKGLTFTVEEIEKLCEILNKIKKG